MVAISNIVLFIGAATAAIVKRDVATVVADLKSINDQTASLTTAINGFTGGGAAAAVPILTAATALKSSVDKATTDAKAVSSASNSEQAQVIQAVEDLVPTIYASLSALVSKKDTLGSDLAPIAANQLKDLQGSTDSLSAALLAIATGDYKTAGQALSAEIDAGFVAAQAFSPLPATTPIPIPTPGGGSTPSGSAPASPTATPSGSAPSTPTATGSAPSTPTASGSAPAVTATSTAAASYGGGSVGTTKVPSGTVTAPLSIYTGGAAMATGMPFAAAVMAVAAMVL